jgi:hypothetical protein
VRRARPARALSGDAECRVRLARVRAHDRIAGAVTGLAASSSSQVATPSVRGGGTHPADRAASPASTPGVAYGRAADARRRHGGRGVTRARPGGVRPLPPSHRMPSCRTAACHAPACRAALSFAVLNRAASRRVTVRRTPSGRAASYRATACRAAACRAASRPRPTSCHVAVADAGRVPAKMGRRVFAERRRWVEIGVWSFPQ